MSIETSVSLNDMSASDLRAIAEQSNAWPFEQAKQIVARLKKKPKNYKINQKFITNRSSRFNENSRRIPPNSENIARKNS